MDPARERERMLRQDLRPGGIHDERVLAAMAAVPRERFVPEALRHLAHANRPLPIGHGQTISQPFIVALMLQEARLGPMDRVLDVGAGSGYAAAVAARLAREVIALERLPALAAACRGALAAAGAGNVRVIETDGSAGWTSEAPYDAILVGAAGPHVPAALRTQLAGGGRLVMPVGARGSAQRLVRLTRRGTALQEDDLGPVAFVPLIGADAFPEA